MEFSFTCAYIVISGCKEILNYFIMHLGVQVFKLNIFFWVKIHLDVELVCLLSSFDSTFFLGRERDIPMFW